MLIKFINKITKGQNLSEAEASQVVDYFSTGEAKPTQIAAFLAAIKTKEETVEEITGFAKSMLAKAVKINIEGNEAVVDSCGTGGDAANTFNVSTASAIVAAASGLKVAKHSNAGFSSKCGSSNVLEALRIPLVQQPEAVISSLNAHSIAFIHAPYFHKSTFHVNAVRKELGIRTIFNFLGPMTNPARPTGQVIGVPNAEMLPKMAETLKNLGCKKALVVCGIDPVMDEMSICGKTLIYELVNEKIKHFEVTPEDFGIKTASLEDIEGGLPDFNAKIIEDIFAGKLKGAKRDILSLNTGAVLWAGNKAESIKEGVMLSEEIIESGLALEKLESLRL